MSKEILMVAEAVSNEKGVDQGIIFEAIEQALAMATKKRYDEGANIRVVIDRETGDYQSYRWWDVVADDQMAELGTQFTTEEAINGEYILEVSSPGMDRPLYELDHYQQFIGEDISLRLRFPYEGRRNFKGRLTAVDGDEVVVVVADTEFLFPVEGIEKANVVPRF